MHCPRLVELIAKKKKGKPLDAEEINFFVECAKSMNSDHALSEKIAADPSQIGSMLMAIYMNGMNDEETQNLTSAMKNSGFIFSWPAEWKHLVVDKHSTGGVGDKISLVLAPVLAAVGLKVPMISGRSLAHTGGTLDKMESIPGFCVEQSVDTVIRQIEEVGCCIVGQTNDINPADRVLYHTRDITATVDQPSLITASIVSKKLAEGVSCLVYDVKFGNGSVFQTEEEALEMAKRLVIASSHETKCCALFTDMNSPIGYQIGNSLEVLEAVESLQGRASADIVELVEELGGELMCLTGLTSTKEEAKLKIHEVLENGSALQKFYKMVTYQGVSEETATILCYGDAKSVLPKAKSVTSISHDGPAGYVTNIDASALAHFWRQISNKASGPDLAAGLTLKKHVGEAIKSGDTWLDIHHNNDIVEAERLEELKTALKVSLLGRGTQKRVHKKIYAQDGKIQIDDL